jgi:Clp amino terminal domain, pathogenicity island component/ClpX C4-type zinc finger
VDAVDLPALVAAVGKRGASSPLEKLGTALAISVELESSADELVGYFVAEARGAGCSWTEVGQQIGVSKQAARQRFANDRFTPGRFTPDRLTPDRLTPDRLTPDRLTPDRLTQERITHADLVEQPRLVACREAARREAAEQGADEVGTHHQLAGLFEEGTAAAILERLGIRADAVRHAVREMFPVGGKPAAVPPPESQEATAAIAGAAAMARRAGHGYVGTEHLLAALALDPGSRARRILIRLDASIPAIKKELECYISPRGHRRRRGKKTQHHCSFCGKSPGTGVQLVAGPGVWICGPCIDLAREIVAERASISPEQG